MKILVVGSGGREHALVWKLASDSKGPEIFCAPGNAGTAELATNLQVGAEDVEGLCKWAGTNKPDLVVVGPEAPLCAGLVDKLNAMNIRAFGPVQAAAQMEGSKSFSKEVMEAAGVPTAKAKRFTDARAAIKYARSLGTPLVVKADGLAAGKGVSICQTEAEAEQAIRDMMEARVFGEAGAQVLVEEFLQGEEASILALVDGHTAVMLSSAQDHKRIFDNDAGPNTGGMGAYSPAPVVNDGLWPTIREQVFARTLHELNRRGIVYKGVLYAGLMIHKGSIKVLEFNCRFGDPETQAILPRIDGDLIPALEACIDGKLKPDLLRWRKDACVSVVMASGGYPGNYAKGKPITGLNETAVLKDVVVFHAGTALKDGMVVTSGGRVLGVTALGRDLPAAVKRAYEAVDCIRFEGCQFRKDIAQKAFKRH